MLERKRLLERVCVCEREREREKKKRKNQNKKGIERQRKKEMFIKERLVYTLSLLEREECISYSV